MRIIEIYTLPGQDHYTKKFQLYFTNVIQTIPLSTGLEIKISKKKDQLHVGAFDNNLIVSYIQLVKLQGYWQLIIQTTDRQHRNQGYIRRCIEIAIQHLGAIISDEGQTPEAQMVWKALIRRPNALNFYFLDLRTNTRQKIIYNHSTNSLQPDPYENEDPEIRILATSKQMTESESIRRKVYLEQRIKLGHGDPWLGQNFTEFNP